MNNDWPLIESVAAGNMTGELGEWPFLREALRNHGHPLPPDTSATEVIELCRKLVAEKGG